MNYETRAYMNKLKAIHPRILEIRKEKKVEVPKEVRYHYFTIQYPVKKLDLTKLSTIFEDVLGEID